MSSYNLRKKNHKLSINYIINTPESISESTFNTVEFPHTNNWHFNEPVSFPIKQKQKRYPKWVIYILQEWLFKHWNKPYPTENEKIMLCEQTNMSKKALNMWFSNARRRFMKQFDNACKSKRDLHF